MKKKQEKEEKEKKRKQRAEKKRQCEEEKQKKADRKRQRAEEKIQKEKDKASKALEQSRKRAQPVEEQGQGAGVGAARVDRSTAKRCQLEDDSLSSDQCCACFQAFQKEIELGAGTEWVQCACTRWLHKNCALDCIEDSSDKEKLCLYCT